VDIKGSKLTVLFSALALVVIKLELLVAFILQVLIRLGNILEILFSCWFSTFLGDQKTPCRDDYICAESFVPERGVCVPPYFLFQFRVDGHPKGNKI